MEKRCRYPVPRLIAKGDEEHQVKESYKIYTKLEFTFINHKAGKLKSIPNASDFPTSRKSHRGLARNDYRRHVPILGSIMCSTFLVHNKSHQKDSISNKLTLHPTQNMIDHASRIQSLEFEIAKLESQLQALRNDLAAARSDTSSNASTAETTQQLRFGSRGSGESSATALDDGSFSDMYGAEILSALAQPVGESPDQWPLGREEYKRYGRQLIMPEIGLPGQLRLKSAKVLIVGVGGLGCPAAMYLAGAGVGTLALVDGDEVEESNLHRQVLHTSGRVGMSKVNSAIEGLREYVDVLSTDEILWKADLHAKIKSAGELRAIQATPRA